MVNCSYSNVLLKLSGEALLGEKGTFFCPLKLQKLVEGIKKLIDMDIKLSLVIGGGNIIRGRDAKNLNISRHKIDNIGMLATVINAITLEDYLNQNGIAAVMLSALEIPKVGSFYTAEKAIELQKQGKVVVFSGGISNPYFSTDTSAVLRAMEIGADIVLKGTQVDGVYNKDPKIFKDAKKIDKLSHREVVDQRLEIMDTVAILLAEKVNLPIKIFNLSNLENIRLSLIDKKIGSIIIS